MRAWSRVLFCIHRRQSLSVYSKLSHSHTVNHVKMPKIGRSIDEAIDPITVRSTTNGDVIALQHSKHRKNVNPTTSPALWLNWAVLRSGFMSTIFAFIKFHWLNHTEIDIIWPWMSWFATSIFSTTGLRIVQMMHFLVCKGFNHREVISQLGMHLKPWWVCTKVTKSI